jgi:hypothetical protein
MSNAVLPTHAPLLPLFALFWEGGGRLPSFLTYWFGMTGIKKSFEVYVLFVNDYLWASEAGGLLFVLEFAVRTSLQLRQC